jgi:hydroxymethylpyrimidine pyrophosphatase-like HAD family hydrolase
MQYKMFATDVDNTLVPFGEAAPRPAVAAAVRRLQGQGAWFVLCTGRGLSALKACGSLLGGLRYDYAICSNGAYVVDGADHVVYENPMTSEEMYALVDFCEDYEYPLEFIFPDGYYAYVGYEALRGYYRAAGGAGLSVQDGEDQDRHLQGMPAAAVAVLPADGRARFAEKYGYLGLVFTLIGAVEGGVCLYDVTRAGVDKGAGLAGLCRAVGVPLSAVAAAGDGHNDVEMLAAAGLGCAMANGGAAVRAAADRVLPDVREDGLLPLLDELWPERQP